MNKRTITAVAAFVAALALGAAIGSQPLASDAATSIEVRAGIYMAQPTSAITATATVSAQPTPIPTLIVPTSVYQAGGTGSFAFIHPAFERVWDRTDHPLKLGQVTRTWFWGPGPNTTGLTEPYNDSPLGDKSRTVQYFDKSRMELNDPNADPSKPFFVTNGLLTVELISGFIQLGERDFVEYHPACTPMSGDFGDSLAPTYFAYQKVSNSQAGDHFAPNLTGQKVTETIDRNGNTGTDPSKANVQGVELVQFEKSTRHNIPRVFWDFLNSAGTTHNERHEPVMQQLITPWFFASGLPISEPYWAKARIRGNIMDVMIQAYERRVLTYVPSNGPGFQVEMGNIGQHYFDWRYRNAGICPGGVGGNPTTPVPLPTSTAGATRTPSTSTPIVVGTAMPKPTQCPTCPSPTPTATINVPPSPIVTASRPTLTATPARTATSTRTPTP
ncbi:MAG TPA: hypothetical protein VJ183_18995 [Chloroflexia bacterium]|nr:hypothetical protein [Chloroflexia bacterium]